MITRLFTPFSSGPAPFLDPTEQDFLELNLDANNITGKVDGDPLDFWPATYYGGVGRGAFNPNPARYPTYRTVATLPNGNDAPTVQFNPALLQSLFNPGLPGPVVTNSRGMTYYTWFKNTSNAQPIAFFSDLLGGQPRLVWAQDITIPPFLPWIGWRDGLNAHSLIAPPSVPSWNSLIYVFNPPAGTGQCEVYLNGNLIGSDVWSFGDPEAGYIIGGSTANDYFNGNIYRHLWFSQAHNPFQRIGIRNFLVSQWGWG